MPEVRVAHAGENAEVRVISVLGDDGMSLSFAIPASAVPEIAEALLAEPKSTDDDTDA